MGEGLFPLLVTTWESCRPGNPHQYVSKSCFDLVIGHAQHATAPSGENTVAFFVMALLVLVDRAIDFYDQAGCVAIEVDDEAIDDLLAAEMESVESMSAQPFP